MYEEREREISPFWDKNRDTTKKASKEILPAPPPAAPADPPVPVAPAPPAAPPAAPEDPPAPPAAPLAEIPPAFNKEVKAIHLNNP